MEQKSVHVIYYIPDNAFDDEKIVCGIFTTQKEAEDAFRDFCLEGKRTESLIFFPLDSVPVYSDFPNCFVYEEFPLNEFCF